MHGVGDIRNTLIGHGVGISRQSFEQKTIAGGPLSTIASIGIGKTAFSAVLWEIGVFGLLSVVGLFFSGFLSAIKLSKRYSEDKTQKAIFRAVSAAMAVLFISFMTKGYFVYQVAYQTILFTMLGYLTYWERRSFIEHSANENKDKHS